VPDFRGSYLASNLDIYNPETGKLQPLAPRFKKFKTKNQGIRILAFGFIFDFTGNANNTVVHKVRDTVKEDWFKEAIQDKELDLIVVFGHVDIRSPEYATLYATIRKAQWDTPIQFFGGHTHIRDYKVFDRKSVALESGRYMVRDIELN
jgi:2',3'-cyclic-nucleotide 2'-phosphodiesterase (5'-nucleotidase family)